MMDYNRTLTDEFSGLIEKDGSLRWLFDFIKNHDELDFLIGKHKGREWISVYRGLSRVLTITKSRSKDHFRLDAAEAYKALNRDFYGVKKLPMNFSIEFSRLLSEVAATSKFDRYYKNKKEGYYQNILSRQYGFNGFPDDDFVIIDKEAVVGYKNTAEKIEIMGEVQKKYKNLQGILSHTDPRRFGGNLEKKSIGNELDFLALDKEGNILLIEYKHGTNTSGIYLSPLQIGMYYDLFNNLPFSDLVNAVYKMLAQKQKIGLIHPDWQRPEIKAIVPVLIISEFPYKGSAVTKFQEVMNISRRELGGSFLSNLRTYNYTEAGGLTKW